LRNNIRIEPEWIPRGENELADYYSLLIDYDDYMLNPAVFQWIDSLWGPHTVDKFANPLYSMGWFPGTLLYINNKSSQL